MSKPNIFFRLTKVDISKREVTGIATAELPDQTGEVCDYETTKPFYQKWSDGIKKSTSGKSLGNVREMHSNIAAGKIVDLDFDDANKAIRITAKVVDESSFNKVVEGVLTGFSQGGEYVKKWKDGEYTRYTANPTEVSLVDLPCLAEATFEVIKADGSSEIRKLHVKQADPKPELEQVWKAKDGSIWPTKAEAKKQNDLLDAHAAVSKTTEPVQALLDGITDALDKNDAVDDKADAVKPDIKKLLAKESWDAACAIDVLMSIENLACREGDEPEQMADLTEAMKRIKAFIAAEIMEGGEDDEALAAARAATLKKAEEESAGMMEHAHAIHKAASGIMKRCMKCMGSDAEKILKSADGEDGMHDHLKAIHKKAGSIADHAVAMGAKADAEDEADGGDDEDTEKFMKMSAVNTALEKALTDVTTQLTEIQKRLKIVESQPAERKGTLMVVKGHEREDAPDAADTRADETRSFNISGLSPEEARKLLI